MFEHSLRPGRSGGKSGTEARSEAQPVVERETERASGEHAVLAPSTHALSGRSDGRKQPAHAAVLRLCRLGVVRGHVLAFFANAPTRRLAFVCFALFGGRSGAKSARALCFTVDQRGETPGVATWARGLRQGGRAGKARQNTSVLCEVSPLRAAACQKCLYLCARALGRTG